MFTTKPIPGKYEGNKSQLMARIINNATLEGYASAECGDVETDGGWNALVIGKRYGFILNVDNYGFVSVSYWPVERAKRKWNAIVKTEGN